MRHETSTPAPTRGSVARAGTRSAHARRHGQTRRTRVGSVVALAAAAFGAGVVGAAGPDAQTPADVVTIPGSIWLVAGSGTDVSFHTNPRIGEAAESSATATRDPVAPATGIWYITHLNGRTYFDTNPVIETGAGPEDHLASR